MQVPAYFQELMTGVVKDFSFAITYLDDIIIFSRTVEDYLRHIKQVFDENAHLSMKLSKCHFFNKEIQYIRHIVSTKAADCYQQKLKQAINNMYPQKTAKQVWGFHGLFAYYRKLYQEYC